MRNILFFIILLLVSACHQPDSESKLPGTIAGVYTLESASYKKESRDSASHVSNRVKIYTGKHYIYGSTGPDSTATFGFGSYILTDSAIIEKNIFNSSSQDSAFETTFSITRSPSAFIQFKNGASMQGVPYVLSETYKKISGSAPSDLDGAWEQVSFVNITGADTTVIKNKQYKVYQGGHFMWIHRYPSASANKTFQTGYGFGIFTIKDKTITETITSSNYNEIIEAPVTVSFSLTGNNQLVLVFTEDNSVTTEIYRKLN